MKPNKHYLFSGLIVAGLTLMSIFATLPIRIDKNQGSEWMKNVADNQSIKTMSIPGSHDSGAMYSIGDLAGKCQDETIKNQLHMGIRFFDIRLQLVKDKFKVVHGIVDESLSFESVVKDFNDFLTTYPSEALLVSIKEEESSKDSTLGFEEALINELKPLEDKISDSHELPNTLGELRGKMQIFARYSNSTLGIPSYSTWRDNTSFELNNEIFVQDYYKLPDVDEKIEVIKETFNYSNTMENKLTINFTSGYLASSFPPSYSGTTAKGVNNFLKDYLPKNPSMKLGIVVSDFVTNELAQEIYRRNY